MEVGIWKMFMIFSLSYNQECLEFFNIPEARSAHYFLMDKRWNLIHYSKVDDLMSFYSLRKCPTAVQNPVELSKKMYCDKS